MKIQKSVTQKLSKIKKSKKLSDQELCDLIGISKPSLYERKRKHNWKVSEAYMINHIVA